MEMLTVKRFGVLSVGVISGILSAVMGLIIALFMVPFMAIMSAIAPMTDADFGPMGWMFSGFFIIIAPIFYGVWGFIWGIISAALYNVFARWVGGIKVEFEPKTPTEGNA
ncbi:hypothetical protein ACFLUK_03100 [Chloroflexota bacterium]